MKVFALKSSRSFGEAVAREIGIPLCEHEERDFEDGEHKVRPMENVRNQEVFVIHSLYGGDGESVNDKLCRMLFFISALKDSSAKNVTAVIPYLCYARKDRRTKPRDPLTTRYVAQLIEAAGATRVLTIDIHNLQAFQNAFRIPTEHLESKNLFADFFVPIIERDELVIMSPDVGGIKRVEQFQQVLTKRLGKAVPIGFMEKYRSKDVVSGEAVVGNVKHKTVIVLDDMISSGGTMARAALACKKAGANRVFVAATHGIFIGNANQTMEDDSIVKLAVTNTIPPFRLNQHLIDKKVTVLNVAPLFAEAIKRIYEGGSVAELMQ